MSQTTFKEVDYSLNKLIEDIDLGEIGLPDIQRPFVWENSKVRDLFDSMYRGFPVGYLLFWATGAELAKLKGDRQIGTASKQKPPRLLIVDGQQRLTSLYAVIKAKEIVRKDFSKGRIPIAFRPRDRKFEVADAAIRRDPEFIRDISELWAGSRHQFVKAFIAEVRKHRELDDDAEDHLVESIDRLYDLQLYPFSVVELSANLDEEQVADVFVRINSKGTPLVQADFILTLMSVHWDEGRTALEEFSRNAKAPGQPGKPTPFNHFIKPDPDDLLRVAVGLGFRRARLQHVYSILRGKDLSTREFSVDRREEQFMRLKGAQDEALHLQRWQDFLRVLLLAGYRSEAMITSKNALLYTYVLFLIGRRDYELPPDELRRVMAEWFFMVAMTGRYAASPETTMEADLARMTGASDSAEYVERLRTTTSEVLTDDFWAINLPSQLATSGARTPTLFAYNAALCLLGAKALFSQLDISSLLDPTTAGSKSAVERHHLFPKRYLKRLGITKTRDTNQIANYAYVEWWRNIEISDSSPAEYFPKYVEAFMAEGRAQELRQMMHWHALPEGWQEMDYADFLNERRRLIAQVTKDGFQRLQGGAVRQVPESAAAVS
jgi:hypothetical protein